MPMNPLSRRTFLAMSAMAPFALNAQGKTKIPVGIEMYSVRNELKRDPQATVKAVAQMGYEGLEFYGPYFDWTEAQTKQTKKLLDDLGIRCFSTHNNEDYFSSDKIQRARDMNLILGSKYMVMSSAQVTSGLDGWKAVADKLNKAAETVEPSGLKVGYHNHQPEFRPIEGKRPIEILANNTKPTVMLQLDVGTCVEVGSDPVAWIRSNPGRIHSIHCKDWSPEQGKGYTVLFGEGSTNWKGVFTAAESVGGIEYYLVEQEGSRFSELETARKCLETFRSMHTA
jgi:sugar phosphate isomerase/epimerase